MKHFKRPNVGTFLRGTCLGSQNKSQQNEEVVTLNEPNTLIEASEGAPITFKSFIKKFKTKSRASKAGINWFSLFASNRHVCNANIPVVVTTPSPPRWRFWKSRKSSIATPKTPPCTPLPPTGSPAAAAAALSLPLPVAAPVDLSPLATGMHFSLGNPDDFVIRASTSPRFEVLSRGTGISRREITMNDIRDELDKIFAQLPASKASPTKATTKKVETVNRSLDSPSKSAVEHPKSAAKTTLILTPTSDPSVQTDLSDAEGSPIPFGSAGGTNVVDDGKALYSWGNSGHTMSLAPYIASKLCMRCIVSVPTSQAPKPVTVAPPPVAPISTNEDKVTVAWGNSGHTMTLYRATAAKFGMKCILSTVEEGFSTPVLCGRPRSPLSTPFSGALTVGPIKSASIPSPTPKCSPEDSFIFSRSATSISSNAAIKKKTPIVRTSTFDAASIMLKLENNGVTPPPSITPKKKSMEEISIAELVSMPLCELYPELYGPDDKLLSPYKHFIKG